MILSHSVQLPEGKVEARKGNEPVRGASKPTQLRTGPLLGEEIAMLKQARRLNVGGISEMPEHLRRKRLWPARPGDVTMNINSQHKPQILGDVNKLQLPLNVVPEAIMERFPVPQITARAVKNVGGAVQPGGTFSIHTGVDADDAQIIQWLHEAGFEDARLVSAQNATGKVYAGTRGIGRVLSAEKNPERQTSA